jgi:hypothetical protein
MQVSHLSIACRLVFKCQKIETFESAKYVSTSFQIGSGTGKIERTNQPQGFHLEGGEKSLRLIVENFDQ